jgi:hypothetical protein
VTTQFNDEPIYGWDSLETAIKKLRAQVAARLAAITELEKMVALLGDGPPEVVLEEK